MDNEEIIILDFGSQYSHLIARRLRGTNIITYFVELNIYCELLTCLVKVDEFKERKGIKVFIFGLYF